MAKLLLPGLDIFEGAEPLDCIRQSLIALATSSVDKDAIAAFIPHLLEALNEGVDELILSEIFMAIKKCFESTDREIISQVDSFVAVGERSRGHLLASIIALNSMKKVDPDFVVNEQTGKFLDQIGTKLYQQFHSFKPHKSYSVGEVVLSSDEGISVMMCILRLIEIKSEDVLRALLFLWHFEETPSEAVDFYALLGKVDAELFRSLFRSQPRELFLYLCGDPKSPSTICPVVADKLNDFSDVEFFMKVLPIPGVYLDDEVIGRQLQQMTSCRVLSARVHHPLLKRADVWRKIITSCDEECLDQVADCFLANVSDVSETMGDIVLDLDPVTRIACLLFARILGQDSELKSEFSQSQAVMFKVTNMTKAPPVEFWDLLEMESAFRYMKSKDASEYGIALIGMSYYLIKCNMRCCGSGITSLRIPEVSKEMMPELIEYANSMDGSMKSAFSHLPTSEESLLLIGSALYTTLSYRNENSKLVLSNVTNENVFPFLMIELRFFNIISSDGLGLDVFMANSKRELDVMYDALIEMQEKPTEFIDFCICRIFEGISSSKILLDSPAVSMTLLVLARAVGFGGIASKSESIAQKFCESVTALGKVVDSTRGQIANQIVRVFSCKGRAWLQDFASNWQFFEKHKLSLNMFFENADLANGACTECLSEDISLDNIRFLMKCFVEPPKCCIGSPEKVKRLFVEAVEKGDWDNAGVIVQFLDRSGRLDALDITPREVLNLVVHAPIDVCGQVPEYLGDVIQSVLKDEKTQIYAIVKYVRSMVLGPLVDLRNVLGEIVRHFSATKETVLKALMMCLERWHDGAYFMMRAKDVDVDEPSESAYSLVELFVDALIRQPTAQLYIMTRALFVSYPCLFERVSEERRIALINCCMTEVQKDFSGTDGDHGDGYLLAFSAELLLWVCLTEPSYADVTFRTLFENLDGYSVRGVMFVFNLCVYMARKPELLQVVLISHMMKQDGLRKLGCAFDRCTLASPDSLPLLLPVYNQLMEFLCEFFSASTVTSVVYMAEVMKTPTPCAEFLTRRYLRTAFTLNPVREVKSFSSREQQDIADSVAATLLTQSEREMLPAIPIMSQLSKLLEPTKLEDFADLLPKELPLEALSGKSINDQALHLRSMIKITCDKETWIRTLVRQPDWVKVWVVEEGRGPMLSPCHYAILAAIAREANKYRKTENWKEKAQEQKNWFYQNNTYTETILTLMKRSDLSQSMQTQCLDNLKLMLQYGVWREKVIEKVLKTFNEGRFEDLRVTYIFLMVCIKSRYESDQLFALFEDGLLAPFLQRQWRMDRHRMELLGSLVKSVYQLSRGQVLPRRITQLISFLYLINMYDLANSLSMTLSDRQKEGMRSVVEWVYKRLEGRDELEIALMGLVRAYPFLNRRRDEMLQRLEHMLKYGGKDLDTLAAMIGFLVPEEECLCDKDVEPDVDLAGMRPLPLAMPTCVYSKFPAFWDMVGRYKWLFTEIGKTTRFKAFISSPLNIIFRFPIVESFELKLSYFAYSQRRKLEEQTSIRLEFSNENVLQQSITEIMDNRGLSDWKVQFVPSVLDSDCDWYEHITNELFDGKGVFTWTPNGQCLTFNPRKRSEQELKEIKFAGFFIGLCLLQNRNVPVRLAPSIFKALLGTRLNLRDMELIDVALARSYRRILKNVVSDLGLFFTAATEKDGAPIEVDLIPNGRQIPVTELNKVQYVSEMLKFQLYKQISQQLDAFKEGFFACIERKEIGMFTADELEMLICGKAQIDAKQLIGKLRFSAPYSNEHPVIKLFCELIKLWESKAPEYISKLLWFITGSSFVLPGGKLPFDRDIKIERGRGKFPVAHTCLYILDLPEYRSVDVMDQMFRLALDTCHK